ncbi:MAG: hypothetical protein WBF65_08465 [Sphingopyxis granuli]|uniref:hypothetical protein n=1 Tax=Sphingopyxis granuli TaxID=267128 RepID=UPI003C7250FF
MDTLDLRDWQREGKTRDHCLSVDSEGREILIGLTRAESEWLVLYEQDSADAFVAGKRTRREDSKEFLRLHEKHECARLKVLHLAFAKPEGSA